MDDDGYSDVHHGVKDMIILGGENFYPAEVETALYRHPSVADVALIGVPNEHWGEVVKAIVVRKPYASATAEELIALLPRADRALQSAQLHRLCRVVAAEPLWKLLKRVLHAPYWEGRERQVH